MSNHVHYLIRPAQPEQMPRLMHWLNWYSAMLLNRLLHRRGHFWEHQRHGEAARQMPPGLIEQQHRLPIRLDHPRDLRQVEVHDVAELYAPATRISVVDHPSANSRLACDAAFDCLAKALSCGPKKWERRAMALAMVKLQCSPV